MNRRILQGIVVMIAAGAIACGGNPQPETEPTPDTATVTDRARQDSIARARERERAADELCRRAEAALQEGRYEEARSLFEQAIREYGGTGCAERADRALEAVSAVEVVKERIHFEFDRSAITDEAAEKLQRKAEVLRQNPQWQITIEGHCDERGSLEYNQALGMRRAEATKRYLVSLGLDAERFRTVSFGEERPAMTGSNETAWAMNRRSEFVIENPGAIGTN